jgi:hypothetical protein
MKVDSLKNVANSLTKSVSTEKFSWCRGSMGIVALDFLLCNPVTPSMQRKQEVGECWACVKFFARVVVYERMRWARRGCRGEKPPVWESGGSAPEKKNSASRNVSCI